MKKLLCLLLTVILVFGILPLSAFAKDIEPAGASHTYEVGDIIEFGSYPQTRVTDTGLISKLNSLPGMWLSYNYYKSGVHSDFMKYKDVTYNGEKYRAVIFDSYRPGYCDYISSADTSNQDNNGYNQNITYWFRYESLRWRVLDPSSGYVMCESIIDSQQFYNNTKERTEDGKKIYPNDWKYSDIRTFLNETFYNTAFTTDEQAQIGLSDVSNVSEYSSGDTRDRIYLPSYYDMKNTSYGFSSNAARIAQGTDYAKCLGLYVYSFNSCYFLCSAGDYYYSASYVGNDGCVYNGNHVDYAAAGARPVMTLNLQSETVPLPFHKYAIGDIIEFGSYPQSEVKDEEVLSKLNSQPGSWVSYDYYMDGETSDFMQYKDVTFEGEKYRAVKFESYRPMYCDYSSSKDFSYQDENGYEPNITYWFRYEPIKWRVLDPATGYVMCESIIDSQQFYSSYDDRTINGETVYSNNWEHSDIRSFLNETFYRTAFSADEQATIKLSFIKNTSPYSSYYPCNDTWDKVYLLSYYEMITPAYGFSSDKEEKDNARVAQGTDYAKCQGLMVYSGNNYYYLRSAGNCFDLTYSVTDDGYIYYYYGNIDGTAVGSRPVLKLDFYNQKNGFTDIPETSWYTDACLWCNAKGYITGTGEDTFNPFGMLTRAQFVQILAKVDGVDLNAVKYSGKFTDVKDGVWYARAVQWAVDCGVTGGTGDKTFSPNNAVSREQLATFFMAYAGYKGYDVSATASLAKFTDESTIANWAKSAVTWAIAEGLISGTTDTTISPKKSATRAQAAVIFRNFAENYLAKQKK